MNVLHHQQPMSSSKRYQQEHQSQQQLQQCISPKISRSDGDNSDNDDIDNCYSCQDDSDSCTVCIIKHQSNMNNSRSIFKHSTICNNDNIVDKKVVPAVDMEFDVNCRSSFHTEQTQDLTQSDSTSNNHSNNNNNCDTFYNSFRYDDDDDHDDYYETIERPPTLENNDKIDTAVLPLVLQQQQASAGTPVAVTAATTTTPIFQSTSSKTKHTQKQSITTTTTTPIIQDSHLQVQFAERTASEMKNIVDWWQYRQQQHLRTTQSMINDSTSENDVHFDTTTIVSQHQELLGNSLLMLFQSMESLDSQNPIISTNENKRINSNGVGSTVTTTSVRRCASLAQSPTPNSIDAIDSTYQAQFAERTASEMKEIISWWKQCHPKQNSKYIELLYSENAVDDNVCTRSTSSTSICSLNDEAAMGSICQTSLEELTTTTLSKCPQRHHCPNNSLLLLSSSSSSSSTASNSTNKSSRTKRNNTEKPKSNFASIQKELYDSIKMSRSSRRRFHQTTFASNVQQIQSINSKSVEGNLISGYGEGNEVDEERDDLNISRYHYFDAICRDLFETEIIGEHYEINNVPSSGFTTGSTCIAAETKSITNNLPQEMDSQTSCIFDVDCFSPHSAHTIHNDLNHAMEESDIKVLSALVYETPIQQRHNANDSILSELFSARFVTPKQIHYRVQKETENVNEICSITKDIARTVETILYESTRKQQQQQQQQQQQRFQLLSSPNDYFDGKIDSNEEQIPALNFMNRLEVRTYIAMRRIEHFMFIILFEYILPIDFLTVYVFVQRFNLYLQSWLSTSQRVLLLQCQQRLQRYANYALCVLCLYMFLQRQLLQYTSNKLSTVNNTCNQPQSLYSSNSVFDIRTRSSLSVSIKGDLLVSNNFIEYDGDYITGTTISYRTTDIFFTSKDFYQ